MSKFLDEKLNFPAYVPGEQPQDKKYVKLNTNESPFSPSEKVLEMAKQSASTANLYCDPECKKLRLAAANVFKVKLENVMAFNGSDEALSFAFYAYGFSGVAYPEISYGFYPVFSKYYGLDALAIPLKTGLYVDYQDYLSLNRTIVIANPNAPTGLVLTVSEIEEIVKTNPNNVVIIDEAYVEFGAESVICLTEKYQNLLVVRTFSKSHSMAGARLGFAIGDKKLIDDLNRLKYSFNPYNVNSMTQAMGVAAFEDEEYYRENCQKIIATREYTASELTKLGFEVTLSKANFLFAKPAQMSGKQLFLRLREKGFLVRRFDTELIKDYLRISIGTQEDMEKLVKAIDEILNEKKSVGLFGKIKNFFKGDKNERS